MEGRNVGEYTAEGTDPGLDQFGHGPREPHTEEVPLRRPAPRPLAALVALVTLLGALVACGVPADTPDRADGSADDRGAQPASAAALTVLSSDSPWYVLDDDSDPARGGSDPLSWTRAGYATTGWRLATGPFGFKDGAATDLGGGHVPRTVLRHRTGGSGTPAIPTYHFRRTFDLSATQLADVEGLVASITYDDAVRVYVNGQRVGGLDDGAVPAGVNRQYAGSSASAPKTGEVTVPRDALVAGTNVIAIAMHQAADWSSDAYLDLRSLASAGTVSAPPPTRLLLTPAADAATAQTFTWRAGDQAGGGAVQVAPTAGGSVRTVAGTSAGGTNGDPRPHLAATVDGLSPGTSYRWRAGREGGWSAWHTFRTAPRTGGYSFLYFGDAQQGLDTTWPSVVRAAEAKAPGAALAVHIGDLVERADDEDDWQDWYDALGAGAASRTQLLAPGNHEYFGDADMSVWRSTFDFPRNHATTARIGAMAGLAEGDGAVARQYAALFAHFSQVARDTTYVADRGDVRFVALHGNEVESLMRPASLPSCSGSDCPGARIGLAWQRFQAAWLDGVLAASPKKWNVVVLHQPLYSGTAGRDEVWLRDSLRPVIRRRGVDLVLTGHDHVYARGYDDADRTGTAGVTSGPVYVTSNSGPKYYDLVTDPSLDKWRRNGATRVRSGHQVTTFGVVDVTSGSLRYRSWLVAKGPSSSTSRSPGTLFDEFTITKSDAGVTRVTEGWPGAGQAR